MNIANKRILLIDGREDWLSRTEAILRQAGYEVSKAHDCKDAQAVLQREGNSFDLIVANQLQVERAKDALYDLIWAEPDRRARVVVLFSTEPTLPRMREVFKLGVYDCLVKQDEPERMLELLREVIEKQASAKVTS